MDARIKQRIDVPHAAIPAAEQRRTAAEATAASRAAKITASPVGSGAAERGVRRNALPLSLPKGRDPSSTRICPLLFIAMASFR